MVVFYELWLVEMMSRVIHVFVIVNSGRILRAVIGWKGVTCRSTFWYVARLFVMLNGFLLCWTVLSCVKMNGEIDCFVALARNNSKMVRTTIDTRSNNIRHNSLISTKSLANICKDKTRLGKVKDLGVYLL